MSDHRRPVTPVRVQLRRVKGANLQRDSMAINGLPAVKVDRSTKWGNPFRAGTPSAAGPMTVGAAVTNFGLWLGAGKLKFTTDDVRRELRQKNLACWCDPKDPCHAGVLLLIANQDQKVRMRRGR